VCEEWIEPQVWSAIALEPKENLAEATKRKPGGGQQRKRGQTSCLPLVRQRQTSCLDRRLAWLAERQFFLARWGCWFCSCKRLKQPHGFVGKQLGGVSARQAVSPRAQSRISPSRPVRGLGFRWLRFPSYCLGLASLLLTGAAEQLPFTQPRHTHVPEPQALYEGFSKSLTDSQSTGIRLCKAGHILLDLLLPVHAAAQIPQSSPPRSPAV
jgi:hypothetical protein